MTIAAWPRAAKIESGLSERPHPLDTQVSGKGILWIHDYWVWGNMVYSRKWTEEILSFIFPIDLSVGDIDPVLAWLTLDVQVLQKPFLNFLLYFNCIYIYFQLMLRIKSRNYGQHIMIYIYLFFFYLKYCLQRLSIRKKFRFLKAQKPKTIDFPSALYIFFKPMDICSEIWTRPAT